MSGLLAVILFYLVLYTYVYLGPAYETIPFFFFFFPVSSTGSHFLETVLWHANDEFIAQLLNRCFMGHALEYCMHSVSNFVMQVLIQRLNDVQDLEKLYAELEPGIKVRKDGWLYLWKYGWVVYVYILVGK